MQKNRNIISQTKLTATRDLFKLYYIIQLTGYLCLYISQISFTHSLVQRYITKTIKQMNLKFGIVGSSSNDLDVK